MYKRKKIIAIAEDENTNPKTLVGDSLTFATLTGLKDTSIQNRARLGERVKISGVYYFLDYLKEDAENDFEIIHGDYEKLERLRKTAELFKMTVSELIFEKFKSLFL